MYRLSFSARISPKYNLIHVNSPHITHELASVYYQYLKRYINFFTLKANLENINKIKT